MNPEDYTIEFCPYCESEVAIFSEGVTACPECGMLLAPCSVCYAEYRGYVEPCPYGCTGTFEDAYKPVTNPPITAEEIAFAFENC